MTPQKRSRLTARSKGSGTASAAGSVTLVGAGPGDPGLITVRGLGALRAADAILYDRLVSPALLAFARDDAELVFVGKTPRGAGVPQQDINAHMIRLAREGKSVVRLKGGDPYVFGRGGEEVEALVAAGVAVDVVPGVSSALAAPAVAGIPVTHRDAAASVAIVTAQGSPGGAGARVDWSAIASIDTVVVLMGTRRVADVARALIEAGRSPDTPSAIVGSATLPAQRTVTATLGTIARAASAVGPPAVVVVGDVVSLRNALGGWDTRPLAGVRALVTRTREQAGALSGVLRELGADVVEAPSIRVVPPSSWTRVDAALARLAEGAYAWVVLTSANGVRFVFERLAAKGMDARAFGRTNVAAVGTGTAAALAAHGIVADLVPPTFTTRDVARAFPRGAGRILLARADVIEPGLDSALARKGWQPEKLVLYRVRPVRALPAGVRRDVLGGHIGVLTFASGATVRAFVEMLKGRVPASTRVVCIGPVTAREARAAGLRVDAVAKEHTIPGLAAAAVQAARKRRRETR